MRFRVLVALGALAHSAVAQTAPTGEEVDRVVGAAMGVQHIPGVAVAVVKRGRVIRAQGYGLANVENHVAVTPQTVFKIGSVSKQFLASAIMILAQDGRLSVDDEVSKYVNETPPAWKGITLRHLLTHTSGIVREGPAFDPWKTQTDSVVIGSALGVPGVFPVGTKWQYCNVCYFTLAEVIRRVSGKPWSDFVAERIFAPAGMTATRTTTSLVIPRRADGYVPRGDTLWRADDFIALRPSGAFISTVLDLAKWDSVLYADEILSRSSKAAMWTPVTLVTGSPYPYGFGWSLDTLAGHRRVHHGGSLPGFRAELMRFPDDSLTVIVLTNGDSAKPQEIAEGVAALYLRPGTTSMRAR